MRRDADNHGVHAIEQVAEVLGLEGQLVFLGEALGCGLVHIGHADQLDLGVLLQDGRVHAHNASGSDKTNS